MNSVYRRIGFIYRKVSLHVFGNTIKLRINLLYALYIFLIKAAYNLRIGMRQEIAKPSRIKANELEQHGFTKLEEVISKLEVQAISEKINLLFSQPDKTIKSLEDGGLIRLKSCMLEVPELEKYILNKQVMEVIQGYFSGAYKVYSGDVYRTIPNLNEHLQEKFGSLKWHFDNCPKNLLKVMIYLTDTSAENGALTVVNKQKSLDLKRRGFWSRNDVKEFVDEISDNAHVLEGYCGTALLFSVHHCIHKATLPKVRYRDVAVFLVQPSFTQQSTFTDMERRNSSYNFGYCVNPFLNTPLRYGDE